MKISDYIVIAVLVLWAVIAVIYIRKSKKSGKGCASGCEGCQFRENCSKKGKE
ncbi:MAG: FeoB-associated Cys-rich membrane protein [Oscillospiraceae bacterium]|nr:FeoB-associated Cys-rich membrane protein [Oscillospiraceae bacterium]